MAKRMAFEIVTSGLDPTDENNDAGMEHTVQEVVRFFRPYSEAAAKGDTETMERLNELALTCGCIMHAFFMGIGPAERAMCVDLIPEIATRARTIIAKEEIERKTKTDAA